MGLCQPATAILLVSTAGILYHVVTGHLSAVIWWILVGLLGTGSFQLLCRGGLEPMAWILMSIPVLIVCFFLAVALFAARMRIQNVREVPCDGCGRPKNHCGCGPAPAPRRPRCNRNNCHGCPSCLWGGGGPGIDDAASEGFTAGPSACDCNACGCIGGPCPDCGRPGQSGCNNCGGAGCPYCAYAAVVAEGTPRQGLTATF